jgi:sugar phosphate isomerase/epimerase
MTLPIGLQLYTVREEIRMDFADVVKTIEKTGYTGVEPFGLPDDIEQQAKLLKELNFQIPAAHVPMPEDGKIANIMQISEAYELQRVISGFGPEAFKTVEDVKRTCERMNRLAQSVGEHGLTFGYHNHWWEIEPIEGEYPYKIMLDNLDPDIFLEVDVYWVRVGGMDPVEFIKESRTRAKFLHIKDGPADVPQADMVAVGQGKLDMHNIIGAANNAEWLIVELDRCSTDMLEAVEQSFNYLVDEGLGHGR